MIAGEMEVDLVPQGTLIERIRAGGFGLGGISPRPASAPWSRKASRRSRWPARTTSSRPRCAPTSPSSTPSWPTTSANLAYALTGRNFNPVIAMAADTVIVQADNIVPVGVISPDHVVTPAPLVDYLVAQG
jgi:acetate CoA/acetoacetate CoA-transferase alpha subunit